jgi:acyl CoA:acetate/3-ketoacid CoA transferase
MKKSEKKACYLAKIVLYFLQLVRDRNMKEKTVKVKGPWVDGVQTVKEISQEEWTSYTPLNTRVKGQWFRVVKW